MTIEVTTASSLDAFPATFWSSFHQGAGVYQSRPWLEFVDRSAGGAVAYVAATEAGQALGLMPVYPEPAAPGTGYTQTELAGAAAAPGTAWLCGNRRAYRNEILSAALPEAGQQARAVLGMLAAAAAAACDGVDRPTLMFPYVSKGYAAVLCQAVPGAVPVLTKLDANIDIQGRSFDQYVRDLGRKKVFTVRREMRAFERAGYTTGIERLADCWYEAGPLVANVQHRYGHDDTPESCRRGLRSQAELMAGHDVVFTARRMGRLVAMTVCYEWNRTLATRVVGFDYESLVGAMEYFNLNFYQPLEYACARGLTRILLGTGSERAKHHRGARLTGLWTVVAGPDPLPPTGPGSWREHNARVRKQLTAAPVEESELSDEWFRG
jgi:uncharacterized protein